MGKYFIFFLFATMNLFANNFSYKLEKPLSIKSDEAIFEKNSKKIIFKSNVVAKNDDFELKADAVNVNYEESKEKLVNKIIANDNIKLTSKDVEANGDIGIFDMKKQTVTLLQNVVIKNNKLDILSDRFIYDIRTKKSVIGTGDKNKKTTVILDEL
ncbi:MAG: hypothetical protein LBC92_05765 [Rickettsiales bacterium]|jgi:lipopolysaccharide transport protein LptA|nr:hypothetical protein [Rickettsiales bacterium]